MRRGSVSALGSNNRMKGNGLKLYHGRFRLGIRDNFFSKSVAMCWYREVRWSPSLEVLIKERDVALQDVVMGTVGWAGLGPGDLRGHFQPGRGGTGC